MSARLFDWDAAWAKLETMVALSRSHASSDWLPELRKLCESRVQIEHHGTLPKWKAAWNTLPESGELLADGRESAVRVRGSLGAQDETATRAALMEFHPWRKGPFSCFGIEIDTEWRSDWKWERLRKEVDFSGKDVLDVGCGNGYYGWQMIGLGANYVVGCEPFLLYLMQFEVFRRYAMRPAKHVVFPMADSEIPEAWSCFDLALSMGVLYHRTSPIDHLRKLHSTLRPGGEVVLETLVIDGTESSVLVPEGRYAKMRNVWFLPTVPMLKLWLQRTGFTEIRTVDVTATTPSEQRRTRWMTFESLADFLDPVDSSRTIEGYPGPIRAMLLAKKKA